MREERQKHRWQFNERCYLFVNSGGENVASHLKYLYLKIVPLWPGEHPALQTKTRAMRSEERPLSCGSGENDQNTSAALKVAKSSVASIILQGKVWNDQDFLVLSSPGT